MIVAFWCVLIAALVPFACSYLAKYGPTDGSAASTPFDNRHPRAWLAAQDGLRARADAAQANSFEAFPLFAAAVIIAVLQHVPVATIDLIAVVFVIARIGFVACYVLDRPAARSSLWLVGFVACVALFLFAATGSLR